MQSKVYDFFISHSSEDNQKALELKQVLLSINPDWEIMLDCDIDHPFDYSDEWTDAMFEAVGSSRVLIFIASDESYLVEESGCWVYPEVKHFYLCKRDKKKNKDLNKAYFGVIFGDVDIGKVCRQREMYRELYSATQHIVLAADCPVSDAAQRLKNKISAVLKEADNSGVAEMLDMTRRFAKLHFGGDTPAEIGIDEDLCPVITIPEEMGGSVEKSRNDIGFNELVRFVANQNVGIINNDGGSGKTTILTRLFYHYLENFDVENIGNEMLVPIFVDAKTLLAENYLIPRYIAKYLYSEETAMSDRATGETEAKVLQEFAKATEHPQYLLLIDGYNEIPPFAVDDFDAELSQYVSDKYPNIRIVLSGRNIDSGVASFLAPVKLGRLRRYEIENYLKKCEVPMPSGKSLEKILCVPMYLSLYTKAAGTQAVIATRGDLLDQFMQWQLKKSENSELSKKEKAQNEIFLSHLLPAIACRLVMRPENVTNFIFTRDEAEEMLETAISQISSSQYMRWSSDRFIDRLEESQLEDYNIVKLTKSALKFYIKNCRLIDETADGEYEFIHQIYRDYLCAKHIVNEISINTKGSNPDLSSFALKQEKLEQPVVSFIAQILKEKRPYFDSNIECWNYDCNETSLVLKLLSLVRENGLCEEKTLIANIVEILKHIRTGDLSGCDFSGLDLSACDISACVFSRKDKQGVYAANFKGAFITEQNFFSADCFGFINAACVGKNCVITYDTSGMIKFRNLYSRGNYPEKTITGVEMPIHSLVYSDAENCLFGACQNTVFKIKVPEQAVAQVEYETVYTGESTVKELSLGPSDLVLFTTVDNPFNPKPLNAPKTPDTCSYKGFFAGAAVNAKGDELAFGHISRNNGLNICRKDENGEWSLVRDRYSELLQELFDALANKVKEYGLYESFNYISGHNLFDLLPSLFEDRTHRFHEIPSLVIGRMMKYFMDDENKNRPIATLNEQQWEELKKIADSYVEPIRVYTYRKFTLMIATGKSISSLQYKGDSNTLLVAATIDFNRFGKGNENRIKASERYETVVIEVDTKTHETNYIVRVIGARPAKAYYSKEGIIVYNSTFLSVYNQNGKVLKQLKTKPMDMGLFSANGQDGFFIVAHHYIYEMDSNMRCVNAYPNRSNIDNVKYVSDASGVQRRFYFQKYNRTTKQTDNMCINADTGIVFTVDKLPASMRNAEPEITLASGRRFRRINQNMIAYDNAQKTEDFTVPYQLYVKGCDFTGLKGTLSEPHNLRLLDRFGALTDEFECCDMIIKTPAACYNPKRS
ncbi:MAG: hypothetical protein J6Q67_03050, partial [Clostridia bacterium]|nr:hypothetical protein [Clostridia bacterium]